MSSTRRLPHVPCVDFCSAQTLSALCSPTKRVGVSGAPLAHWCTSGDLAIRLDLGLLDPLVQVGQLCRVLMETSVSPQGWFLE